MVQFLKSQIRSGGFVFGKKTRIQKALIRKQVRSKDDMFKRNMFDSLWTISKSMKRGMLRHFR